MYVVGLNGVTSIVPHLPYNLLLVNARTIFKRMRHKFVVADTNAVEWYLGTIVNYNAVEKKHEIQYDDEDELCRFDLILDRLRSTCCIIVCNSGFFYYIFVFNSVH